MAEQVTVALVDDVDGSEADETVEFSLDGVHYAIDLSSEHADALREQLSSYIQHGKRLGGRKKARTSRRADRSSAKTRREQTTTASNRERNQAIRTWAKAAGYEVSDRGRIPAGIVAEYDKAH